MSATHFWCVSPVFMADARTIDGAMHTSVLGSPVPALSSNFGSPDGFHRISKDWALVLEVHWRRNSMTFLFNFAHFEVQLAQIPALSKWRMYTSQTHVVDCRLDKEMEHKFSALTARLCQVETGVDSASSVLATYQEIPRLVSFLQQLVPGVRLKP